MNTKELPPCDYLRISDEGQLPYFMCRRYTTGLNSTEEDGEKYPKALDYCDQLKKGFTTKNCVQLKPQLLSQAEKEYD